MTLFQAFGQFAAAGAERFGLEFITHQTWTSATSLSIDNVFTSEYDNYRILVEASGGNVDVDARLRLSGTDNSTASSGIGQRYLVSHTSSSAARITTDFLWQIFGVARTTYASAAVVDLFSPALAEETRWTSRTYEALNDVRIFAYSGIHNQTTAYDGITVLTTSAATSGAISIYGFRQE